MGAFVQRSKRRSRVNIYSGLFLSHIMYTDLWLCSSVFPPPSLVAAARVRLWLVCRQNTTPQILGENTCVYSKRSHHQVRSLTVLSKQHFTSPSSSESSVKLNSTAFTGREADLLVFTFFCRNKYMWLFCRTPLNRRPKVSWSDQFMNIRDLKMCEVCGSDAQVAQHSYTPFKACIEQSLWCVWSIH